MTLEIHPVVGIPEVAAGDDLAALIAAGLESSGLTLVDGDVVVVASKVLSKAAGRYAEPAEPGEAARELAGVTGFTAEDVAMILGQSADVLRAAPGVLVTETHQGFVCANAGIDHSNSGQPLLLPENVDESAAQLRSRLEERFGVTLAVLISDTFGRPFRNGQVNVALGVAGIRPIRDYRGQRDPHGYELKGTEIAIADELCAAAELVMNKLDRVPVALIRGYRHEADGGTGRALLREPAADIFR